MGSLPPPPAAKALASPNINIHFPKNALQAAPRADNPPRRRNTVSWLQYCSKFRRMLAASCTLLPLISILVPGLGIGLAATMAGVGEVTTAAGTVATATANVTTAFATVAVATSTGIMNVAGDAWHGVDLMSLNLEMEQGAVVVDWLGDFRAFAGSTQSFTLRTSNASRMEIINLVEQASITRPLVEVSKAYLNIS
jgi:hypothetical protein